MGAEFVTLSLTPLLIGTLAVLPPWHSRYTLRFHEWLSRNVGVELRCLDNYSGAVRRWDANGTLRIE